MVSIGYVRLCRCKVLCVHIFPCFCLADGNEQLVSHVYFGCYISVFPLSWKMPETARGGTYDEVGFGEDGGAFLKKNCLYFAKSAFS